MAGQPADGWGRWGLRRRQLLEGAGWVDGA